MSASAALTYRYPFVSTFEQSEGFPKLSLATSIDSPEVPSHFFEGQLATPRAFGDLMLVLSNIVRANFFKPLTPAMLDPVITASNSMLRFEGFSGCCSAYVQASVPESAIEGRFVRRGTTNVDFNDPMRAALTRLNDREKTQLAVGADMVSLESGDSKIVEKKVVLPTRWVRGFCESHIYQGRLKPLITLNAMQARQFMQSTPRTPPRRALCLEIRGTSARWSTANSPGSISVGGAHRVSILEPLTRSGGTLEIFGDPETGITAWIASNASGSLVLMLSPDVQRGFSGEGQALESLIDSEARTGMASIRAHLKWQDRLSIHQLAQSIGRPDTLVSNVLSALGTQGVVGYDLHAQAYFHRELPFTAEAIEKFHGRLQGARSLVAEEKVTKLEPKGNEQRFEVQSDDAVYRVSLLDGQWRCTCPWYGKHLGKRGPCKHVLAVRLQKADQ